ncbi:MAG: DegT/DnrJ/EryC1/StrS family aminotransferase [Paludibacteraceae bacterium]|nr:DegT/DnrJ/EryC1/StrS family aminotransferase [Paludibacteraceae bacterium]
MKTIQPIQMVDLKGQYQRLKEEIDAGIAGVIESAAFVRGKVVSEFETAFAEYLNVRHVISTANGTEAIQTALMALDLQAGDEVITPSFTFVSTAEVVALLGLKPVLVDVDADTFCIDPESIRRAITPRTRAIVPVHLFGQHADMEQILDIAQAYHLYVIEDACQSIGSTYTYRQKQYQSGTVGHIGCTSFFPTKNLGCYGDGGAVYTNDARLAERMRSIANHGMAQRYHYERIGINSRLDSMQAAVLKAKLPELADFIARRQAAAALYDELLADIPTIRRPRINPDSTHAYHQYTIRVLNTDRDRMRDALADHGIPSMVYYPVPLHMQQAYQKIGASLHPCPTSELLSQQVLSLPMHTELSKDQIEYIAATIRQYCRQHGG